MSRHGLANYRASKGRLPYPCVRAGDDQHRTGQDDVEMVLRKVHFANIALPCLDGTGSGGPIRCSSSVPASGGSGPPR